VALEARNWPGALGSARRIVSDHPIHEVADDALERVAAGAAGVKVWPVAHEADTLLRQRYPKSPFVAAGRVRMAEALLEMGRVDESRREIEQAVADAPVDTRTTMLLARIREAAGDRGGALEAYARAAREGTGPEWSTPALLGHARLLVQARRWDQARAVLERLLKNDDVVVATEAAQAIGDTYTGEGDPLAAADLAPRPPRLAGRRRRLRFAEAERGRCARLPQAPGAGRSARRSRRRRPQGPRLARPLTG
jgi:tetratricopeptide (TPR) repeat protein